MLTTVREHRSATTFRSDQCSRNVTEALGPLIGTNATQSSVKCQFANEYEFSEKKLNVLILL